jgi:hypothetical protein
MKKIGLLLLCGLSVLACAAQDTTRIEIPAFNDDYSKYVQKLESGHPDIDYADFRNSYLETKLFNSKRRRVSNYDSLKQQMYKEIKNRNAQEVIRLTKAMLSIDYTSLFAHKYLQQSYKIIGDTANQRKYHDIEFGLLNSIVHSGDGKTCETGWHVTQIEEEYFILSVIGAEFQSQAITSGGKNACDKMTVKIDNEERTYYFEANKVFESEKKLLGL